MYGGVYKLRDFGVVNILSKNDTAITISISELTFSVVDDQIATTPLFELSCSHIVLEGAISLVTNARIQQLSFAIALAIRCDVFSQRVLRWEPILEQIEVAIAYN